MFALKIFIVAVVVSTCNALAVDKAVESHAVKCSFGEPFNITTISLDNGTQVQSWGCTMSAAEIAAHKEQSEDSFKLGTYDTQGLSVTETLLTKRQDKACGINCTTYCYGGAGDGPDPNHCSQLTQGWTSGTLLVSGETTLYFSLASCQVSIRNYSRAGLAFCWNELRGVTNYIAWSCDAAQNAYGGYCNINNNLAIGTIGVSACCVQHPS